MANRKAGELWLDDAAGKLPDERSVRRDEMAMRLRKYLEVLEQDGGCFDRNLEAGDGGGGLKRFWVVELDVGGPRN